MIKLIISITHTMSTKMKLIIFDRGYPSFELIKYLIDRNLNHIMRVKKAFNKDIDAQKDDDGIVWLEQNGEKIKARVIKVLLKSVETIDNHHLRR